MDANATLAGRPCHTSLWVMAATLPTRRLPPLWLFCGYALLTCYQGVVDLLVRPTGVEVFSPWCDLACRHELLSHWPQTSILKSSFQGVEKLLQQLDLPLTQLIDDPDTKCLTRRPDRIRYALQIAQSS